LHGYLADWPLGAALAVSEYSLSLPRLWSSQHDGPVSYVLIADFAAGLRENCS